MEATKIQQLSSDAIFGSLTTKIRNIMSRVLHARSRSISKEMYQGWKLENDTFQYSCLKQVCVANYNRPESSTRFQWQIADQYNLWLSSSPPPPPSSLPTRAYLGDSVVPGTPWWQKGIWIGGGVGSFHVIPDMYLRHYTVATTLWNNGLSMEAALEFLLSGQENNRKYILVWSQIEANIPSSLCNHTAWRYLCGGFRHKNPPSLFHVSPDQSYAELRKKRLPPL